MYKNKYPHLYTFISCYFHQDWVHENKKAENVIQQFLRENNSSEADLIKKELGCCYSSTELTYSEWLISIKSKLGE